MPLNPTLYARLEALVRRQPELGPIATANVGESGSTRVVRMPGGKRRSQFTPLGEAYRINCLFCGERHRKLYINHRYGLPDPVDGRPITIFKCFRSDCQKDPANRRRLWNLLFGPGERPRRQGLIGRQPDSAAAAPAAAGPEAIELPASAVFVDALNANHPAAEYLARRGFDLEELAQTWGVRYVEPSWTTPSSAAGRVLIPVERPRLQFAEAFDPEDRVLIGWQARSVLQNEDVPKYLFSDRFPRKTTLYGLCQAQLTDGPVLICEGPADVWKAGPGAVATFGKNVNRDQVLLLTRHFSDRAIVILPDAGAVREAPHLARQITGYRLIESANREVVVAELPPGRDDPGECTRDEIWMSAAYALGLPQETTPAAGGSA